MPKHLCVGGPLHGQQLEVAGTAKWVVNAEPNGLEEPKTTTYNFVTMVSVNSRQEQTEWRTTMMGPAPEPRTATVLVHETLESWPFELLERRILDAIIENGMLNE